MHHSSKTYLPSAMLTSSREIVPNWFQMRSDRLKGGRRTHAMHPVESRARNTHRLELGHPGNCIQSFTRSPITLARVPPPRQPLQPPWPQPFFFLRLRAEPRRGGLFQPPDQASCFQGGIDIGGCCDTFFLPPEFRTDDDTKVVEVAGKPIFLQRNGFFFFFFASACVKLGFRHGSFSMIHASAAADFPIIGYSNTKSRKKL